MRPELDGEGCPSYSPPYVEVCDGTAVAIPSCESRGYYGGTSSCIRCSEDFSACDVCAPSDLDCATSSSIGTFNDVAVSGSYIALSSSPIVIFDGLTLVSTSTVIPAGIVGVPGGWLVATTPPSLQTLDATGTQGTAHQVAGGFVTPAMAYGGGRVLVAWDEQSVVYAAIADPSGTIVVPTFELFAGDTTPPSATSDGTSFFVAAHGNLARITPDGVRTIAGGFPSSPNAQLTWSGTTGWYTSATDVHAYVTQRFDATGGTVGSAVPIDLGTKVTEFLADGADLLALFESTSSRVSIVRIASSGTAGTSREVGYGGDARVARIGAELVVAWNAGGRLGLAHITP